MYNPFNLFKRQSNSSRLHYQSQKAIIEYSKDTGYKKKEPSPILDKTNTPRPPNELLRTIKIDLWYERWPTYTAYTLPRALFFFLFIIAAWFWGMASGTIFMYRVRGGDYQR